ncbi:cell division protein FtsI (penicillin-binding protein 3) [Bacteroides luti]|uniref:Cell division protein FtsI (Penicillin-binding protein 3) n=1 Tax=Bacteroides luti TaxID=1297750 RepID=A0A1M5A362_9BACE|nr:penicillin-binding protein [Bacteroides luti]SHF24711.1 cell division protein FtsI (penicillin-binding protein 3) [Bacteroides luti]
MAVDKRSIMTRYFFIILLMGLVGVAIVVKAGIIMFAERQYWKDVADRFVKENVIVHPSRGNIISADGKLMASSLPEYKIYMDFKAGGEVKDSILRDSMKVICQGLHKIFPDMSAAEFKSHLQKGRKKGSRSYLIYPKRISYIQYKEVKRLPVFNMNKYKGGFHELAFNQRKKPFGSLATRTLGDVFADTAQGAKNGLELAYDTILKGKNGITHRQKVMNKYLNITDVAPQDGLDIVTTIDVGMQDIAEKALIDKLKEIDATVGVAVLMEVATGEVKAIVNMTKCSDGNYREIKNNAVSDMMEPGSTFKTASIMVALEDGKITPDDGVDTGNGQKLMHGRVMKDHNWARGGYQYLTVPEILMVSSNIGVSSIIDNAYFNNPKKFVQGLYKVGINADLHIPIKGAGKAFIRIPNKDNWSNTALAWMSIGYESQIPPINTLAFYNAIANNGVMIAPKFVKGVMKNGEMIQEFPTEVIKQSICSERTLKQIQSILQRVVSEGLAKPAGSKQFHVSGKTGTAQISQGKGGYKSGKVSYLVSFCGYFPSESPKYSCIVAIQKPGLPASGGLMAGSVFSKIAERVYAKNLSTDLSLAVDSNSVVIPNVKSGEINETKYVLDALKVQNREQFTPIGFGRKAWGTAQQSSNSVIITERMTLKNFMPSVIGMGAKDAVYLLESKGLKVALSGMGKVQSQSIPQGTRIVKGQTVTIQLN